MATYVEAEESLLLRDHSVGYWVRPTYYVAADLYPPSVDGSLEQVWNRDHAVLSIRNDLNQIKKGELFAPPTMMVDQAEDWLCARAVSAVIVAREGGSSRG